MLHRILIEDLGQSDLNKTRVSTNGVLQGLDIIWKA